MAPDAPTSNASVDLYTVNMQKGYKRMYLYYARLETVTAVVLKSYIFWDTTPRSLLKIDRRFGKSPLHLQGPRKRQGRSQHDAG
jgi:hypothetical protein